jgi:hypothetical protein|tara:strand:+ start:327 stop:611 length:285 start_codon:yes stop_codon:yes gene_type:complete
LKNLILVAAIPLVAVATQQMPIWAQPLPFGRLIDCRRELEAKGFEVREMAVETADFFEFEATRIEGVPANPRRISWEIMTNGSCEVIFAEPWVE